MSKRRLWAAVLVPLELTFAVYLYYLFPVILGVVGKAPTPEILALIRPVGRVFPFVTLASVAAWILAIADLVKFRRPSKSEWIAGFLLFPPVVVAVYYATFIHNESSPAVSPQAEQLAKDES